jgi:hypothetical protein
MSANHQFFAGPVVSEALSDTRFGGALMSVLDGLDLPQEVARLNGTTGRIEAVSSLGMRDGFAFDLAAIGKTPHLIDGVLEQQSTAWLIGPSGTYKTFTATSMAVAVATGRPWFGRDVVRGPVIYVCAEGGRAWDKRMAAYAQVHGLPEDRSPLHMRPMPIQIGSPEWVALCELVSHIGPAMVVIDTQAQCTLTYEENSNTEMAKAVSHLTGLSQRSGACVLTVHHSGHAGEGRSIRGRGASAVYAAADTELTMTPKEDDCDGLKVPYVELSATKQKDMPMGHLMSLGPAVVTIEGASDWKARPVTSVVMQDYDPIQQEDSMTADQWAERLIRVGIIQPMGRDKLTEAARSKGIDLPGKATVRAEITRAHRQKVART